MKITNSIKIELAMKITLKLNFPFYLLHKFVLRGGVCRKEGMKVLYIGCGSWYFSIELVKKVGNNGKVYVADLPEEMLYEVKAKIKERSFEP